MTAPTHPPPDSLFPATWVTCDVPGCDVRVLLEGAAWQWNLAIELPRGWCIQPAPTRMTPPCTYCPDHAFRYRGCTPQGRRCRPALRPRYRCIRPRRVLRSYSTDRWPCSCGASARALVATFGVR